MAKKKISGLPAGSALNGTELVPIVQTGTTKRITTQDIANLGNASGVEGSGTINTLAKFTASSTIGNSNLINDANGQLGLGATPSPWSASLVRAFQIGNLGGSISSFTALNTSNPWMFMDNNAYNDGTNDKYILSKAAARYVQVLNEHRWLVAPSGTAGGNITFTQAMTLDANGNLGLGTTSPSAMLTLNATTPYIRIERTGVPTWQIQNNTLVAAAGFSINNITNATTPFFINGTNDFIGIGTAAPLGILHLYKAAASTRMVIDGDAAQNRIITYRTGGVQRFGLYVNNTAESGSNAGSDFAIRAYSDAGTLLSTRLFIKRSTGNVGIGTTNPTSKIQIENTSAGVATVAAFLLNESTTTNTEVRLAFAANANSDIATDRYSYISAINTSGSNGQALKFATNETGAAGVERMRIKANGVINISNIPTSAVGLSAGDIYSNLGVLTIV